MYGFSSYRQPFCHQRAPLLRTKGAKFVMCRQGNRGALAPLLLSCPTGFTVHRRPDAFRLMSKIPKNPYPDATFAASGSFEVRCRVAGSAPGQGRVKHAPRSGHSPLTGRRTGKENEHGPRGISCHWAMQASLNSLCLSSAFDPGSVSPHHQKLNGLWPRRQAERQSRGLIDRALEAAVRCCWPGIHVQTSGRSQSLQSSRHSRQTMPRYHVAGRLFPAFLLQALHHLRRELSRSREHDKSLRFSLKPLRPDA